MFRVYLSGSMAGRVAEQVQAERELSVKLFRKKGIYAIDPGAFEQKLWKKRKGSKITFRFPPKIMDAFVKNDKRLIRHSDALVVLTGDIPSDGTWREMCYAEKIEIPVIMIAPKRYNEEMVGWSNIEVADVVPDLHSAVRLIKRKYVPMYEANNAFFDKKIRNAEKALAYRGSRKTKKKRKKRQ